MRSFFVFTCLFFLCDHCSVSAQGEYRTGLSGFYVPEKDRLNIGFAAFDLHCPWLRKESLSLDYGLRFIGAAAGERGGYFAFGYFSEALVYPGKRLQAGLNLAFLAGGGAAAPDHDGWMTQGTLFTQYQFRNGPALRAGLNYAYVSGGEISGFSPLIGLNWKLSSGSGPDSLSRSVLRWSSVYAECGAAKYDERELGFIGAGGKLDYGRYLSGDVVIHAALSAYGGYMQTLLSAGPVISLSSFHLSPALVLGLGGGGGAMTKGGGLYGWQLGAYYQGASLYAGLKYQQVESHAQTFRYRGLFLSVGKTLKAGEDSPGWDMITKAYVGENGFGNIGARFTALRYKKLRLMGATYWAFTHERGAYAEGLFEATLTAPGPLPFYLVSSVGAGAGSGINQRKDALIYSAGAGLASPYPALPLALETAYWRGGNIPHWSISLSYRLGTDAN